jgi:type I restriction enzyme M protein
VDTVTEQSIAMVDAEVSASRRLIDIVSGLEVPNTPEETDAVQPFARQLLEDYGYPRAHIGTRPQWRVK